MFKATANQKLVFFCRSLTTGLGVSGQAAGMTLKISKDGGALTAISSPTITDLGEGAYVITVDATQTNCNVLFFTGTCASSDNQIEQRIIELVDISAVVAGLLNTLVDGYVTADTIGAMFYSLVAGMSNVSAIKAKTDNLPSSPASSGDVASSEAIIVAEIQTNNGDIAVVDANVDAIKAKTDLLTFTGNDVKATLDGETVTPVASTVRSAIGMASANMDTQLAGIGTKLDTANTAATAIKAKTDNLPADPASETNVNANETKIDAVQTTASAIKTKTDGLPADTSAELAAISDAIADIDGGGGGGGTVVVAPVAANIAVSIKPSPTVYVDSNSTLPAISWTIRDSQGALLNIVRARLAIFQQEDDSAPFIVDTADNGALSVANGVITLAPTIAITALDATGYNLWSLSEDGTERLLVAAGKWAARPTVIGTP